MAGQVMELLEEINAAGTTIIMVTHDASLAARAHRNIRMLDGRIANPTAVPDAPAVDDDGEQSTGT